MIWRTTQPADPRWATGSSLLGACVLALPERRIIVVVLTHHQVSKHSQLARHRRPRNRRTPILPCTSASTNFMTNMAILASRSSRLQHGSFFLFLSSSCEAASNRAMPQGGGRPQNILNTFPAHHMPVNRSPVCSRPPSPPTPCYILPCRGLLLHTFVANAWRTYALQKKLVAKGLVASQEILLQTYVAEWPPKPVTNPVFLIHSRITPQSSWFSYSCSCPCASRKANRRHRPDASPCNSARSQLARRRTS